MVPPPLDPADVQVAVDACLAAHAAGEVPGVADLRPAVRGTLRAFAAAVPGHSVEVRVPPFAAVQCIEGPRHTRGTPRAVVETDGLTWLLLVTGALGFADATAAGRVRASGERSDLTPFLPSSQFP